MKLNSDFYVNNAELRYRILERDENNGIKKHTNNRKGT